MDVYSAASLGENVLCQSGSLTEIQPQTSSDMGFQA